MHDPKVVAHEIRRPWPQRSGLPATGSRGDGLRWRVRLHHEHFTEDEDPVTCVGCGEPVTSTKQQFPWWKPKSYSVFWRLAGRDFYWPPMIVIWHEEPGGRDALTVCRRRYQDKHGEWQFTRLWRWHVHHWRIQVPPLQHLRRWALTRCAWCGGRSRKGDLVNVSHQWNRPRGHWWRGERGLFHGNCSDLAADYRTCSCDEPALHRNESYGHCRACGNFRPWGITPERVERAREAHAHPYGYRPGREDHAREAQGHGMP